MNLHASAVAFEKKAVLILGPSGSGKSTLALGLIALGGQLVADDRCLLSLRGGALFAEAPETLSGKIEARGFGILAATPAEATEVTLAVDLAANETERLPPFRETALLGVTLPLVLGPLRPGFEAAVRQYLMAGRLL
ncbi:HPr kinase/phosphorylase [Paracoccus aminophilus]|uniref:HPr kinase/phosphorylase n=1 Tax=Paracoccus aminophilus JCM 7686 TaxID=1367847 RepID=S5XWG7_PARAH|nr:HPr kinase/phosphatase C-terminal domain-containing protein [Paracoccus aminophilus]AGT07755.1 HPr kinase/phosphorylase [Paracoccus aminophilus JCM 7686]